MSLPAPLARGLFVATSLAGACLAVPASGQYAPPQNYYPPSQPAYGSTHPTTSTYPTASTYPTGSTYPTTSNTYAAPRYYQAQVPVEVDVPEAPGGGPITPLTGGSSVPPPPVNGHYPPPPNGHYPHAAPNGHGYGHNYHGYTPSCTCADGGYNTWGLWSGYASHSPCTGAGCTHPQHLSGRLLGGHALGPGHGYAPGYGVGCAVGPAGDCAACAVACGPAPCRVWFGGIYALLMDRDNENVAWTSYDSGAIENQVLSSRDADVEWQAGNEIRFGSTFVCHPLAWEAVYWGLYEEVDTAVITAGIVGNPISTVFDFGGLDYDEGVGVSGVNSFFDNAEAHRIRRHFEVQNVEINLLYFPLMQSIGPYGVSRAGGAYFVQPGQRFSVVGTAGVRYFRADEGFEFATSPSDLIFGNAAEDMFYRIEMENHLIGFQLGAAANYQATPAFSLFFDSKFGVFVNHIRHDSQIFGSEGFAVVTGGLPFAGEEFNIQSTKDDVSFLGELRLGAAYQVSPHWRIYGGWRAVGIAGYAHPTDQIPLHFAGTPDVRDIDSNGSLILHGLQVGAELNY